MLFFHGNSEDITLAASLLSLIKSSLNVNKNYYSERKQRFQLLPSNIQAIVCIKIIHQTLSKY